MLARLFFALFCAVAGALAVVVVRDSPITLPIVKRFKLPQNSTIPAIDQARAQRLKALHKERPLAPRAFGVWPVAATNAFTAWTAEVEIGTPPSNYTLLIDTSTSITSIGTTFHLTTTSKPLCSSPIIGPGVPSCNQFLDTVTLGGLVVQEQFIELIAGSSGEFDGFLGIGPTDLTQPGNPSIGKSITDHAFAQGALASDEIGIGPSNDPTRSGTITFGGVDTSVLSGPINQVPLTTTSPSSEFVGINQAITYGTAGTPLLASTADIIDTSTTLLLIATDAIARYQQTTGAKLDANTGLLKITNAQYNALQSLFFTINGQQYEFTKNAQLWPRSLNTLIGGDANTIYLIVSDLGSPSGEGLDFVNGVVFLQRFYAVYSTGTNTVGIAETVSTFSTSN